ncbi:mucin-15 [Electrophorus electricus]|uniref:Uncharacterized protein n=1 Tax=Electrophorus electricus TaxID=8005 RepID=A0A4W4H7I2_ELEEL|nr:mucin-15 [Electrophorus electricus]
MQKRGQLVQIQRTVGDFLYSPVPIATALTDTGVSSDIQKNTNNHAWGAILGIGIAVGITALAVYVITKWRNHRDFSHRKLVEDTRCDPVLRLDNSEPLDLKFDGCAYYNPGLQGDNIQMTNFPQGHYK